MQPHGAAALASLEALRGAAPDRVVATTPEGPLRLGELLEAAARVQACARPGHAWVLACSDPFAFLAGLLGLSAAGATALLPPNHLPETLAFLKKEADGLLEAIPTGAAGASLGPLQDIELVFWTSGSTGQPKAVPRRLGELIAEVAVLEDRFGARFQEGPVLGTVPHHHIYGCLFRLLWPLLAGRPFAVEAGGHPDHVPQEHGALVSSPAHLSRMLQLADFATIAHPLAAVFSSGGPLARKDALAWRRWVKDGVVEVYGSTESGGIAWRVQDEGEDSRRWQPFPDVAVALEADGALRVTCPRVPGGALRMEDAATLHGDGRFTLRGRLDRVVKVEEKRASLPELEAALEAQPGVRQAAVLVLEGPRTRLGAVVALDAPPEDAPARRALSERLRQALGQRFDAVLLPRRWRFVPALPVDARGKCSQAVLQALFTEPAP